MHTLIDMLTYARPHGTEAEIDFIERFIEPLGAWWHNDAALVCLVPRPDSRPVTVLFSCHVDTVHRHPGRQRVRVKHDADGNALTAYKDDGTPLGADNAAGVWLLTQMIEADVPGVYVFHRGEERGGIGSGQIADDPPWWMADIKQAVAFDRRGTTSIITHQGMRCCSDTYARALAAALNDADPGFRYEPDDTGIFTDTANYTALIPECTNVSTGTANEHSGKETLDLVHMRRLRDAVLAVDWQALPIERDPQEVDYSAPWGWYGAGRHSPHTTDRAISREEFDDLALPLECMTEEEMIDAVYDDPDYFVSRVRFALGLD